MKKIALIVVFAIVSSALANGQNALPTDKQKRDLSALIDKYSRARETMDTVLLKSILAPDVDQLVSSGEWRDGVAASVRGMLGSSGNNPGTRTLTIEKIRMLGRGAAIVDCRYEIQSANRTRKMWSTFIAVSDNGAWKISAIRNMLPSGQ